MSNDAYIGPQVTSDYWPPDYIGISNGRLSIVRLHDYCPACRAGNHRNHMGPALGRDVCLRPVDPVPHDYHCKCEVTT